LIYFTLPLLKKGGLLIAYKLDDPQEREDAERKLKVLDATIEAIERYDLAGQKRCFLFIRKN
jgi:16S rRNA G527 N7-methylase RsmG